MGKIADAFSPLTSTKEEEVDDDEDEAEDEGEDVEEDVDEEELLSLDILIAVTWWDLRKWRKWVYKLDNSDAQIARMR